MARLSTRAAMSINQAGQYQLRASPAELIVPRPTEQGAIHMGLALTNEHAIPILYKIKVKDVVKQRYELHPTMAVVQPRETIMVNVKVNLSRPGFDMTPIVPAKPDRLLIEQCALTQEEAGSSSISGLWKTVIEEKRPLSLQKQTVRFTPLGPSQRPLSLAAGANRLLEARIEEEDTVPESLSRQDSAFSILASTSQYIDASARNPETQKAVQRSDTRSAFVAEPSPRPGSSALTPTVIVTSESEAQWEHFFPASGKPSGWYRRRDKKAYACGGWSDVWRCQIKYTKDGEAHDAAEKELRAVNLPANLLDQEEIHRRMLRRLKDEVHIWMELEHENIVPLIGFNISPPTFSLFSPWYHNGSVRRYVEHYPDCNRMKLIHEVACGLAYLHSKKIIHGDIKSDNVLVSLAGHAAIIDFGLSKAMEDLPNYTPSLRGAGNARWMAPELVMDNIDNPRTTSSDVYSFGCVALEMFTGDLPFKDVKADQHDVGIIKAILAKQQPVMDWSQHTELEAHLGVLLRGCWSYEPESRPGMDEVRQNVGIASS